MKTSILLKLSSRLHGSTSFEVFRDTVSSKNLQKLVRKMLLKKRAPGNPFWDHFGWIWGPFWDLSGRLGSPWRLHGSLLEPLGAAQEANGHPREPPGASQERPGAPQEPPGAPRELPKSPPERPRGPPEPSRAAPEPPRGTREAPKRALRTPSGLTRKARNPYVMHPLGAASLKGSVE